MYDLIIIGAGPAGCAGAVYSARKRLKTLLLGYEFGGQSIVSTDIQNWIGTPHISGLDLAKNLEAHVMEYKGEILTVLKGKNVNKIEIQTPPTLPTGQAGSPYQGSKNFKISTDDGQNFETKSILITSGSGRKKLEIKGAEEFENKGVTYCASCDGPLFADQDVVVIGGGNAGFETASQLLAYCKSVTLINRSDIFRADPATIEKLSQNPKLRIIKNTELLEVIGEQFVTGLSIKHFDTKEEETIPATGIFVEIGQIANTDFIKDIVKLDKYGKIIVDPMTQMTSIEGIWAAGDVTNGLYHQNNIAAGDAVKALENIYLHLNTK